MNPNDIYGPGSNTGFNYQITKPFLSSVPGKVAVEPKTVQQIQTKKAAGGFMEVVDAKNSLTELKVMFPTVAGSKLTLVPGDSVVLYSQSLGQPFGSEVFELDGVKFVLVPEELVLMVRAVPVPKWNTWISNT